jgi:YVTN family beta-propeller protein
MLMTRLAFIAVLASACQGGDGGDDRASGAERGPPLFDRFIRLEFPAQAPGRASSLDPVQKPAALVRLAPAPPNVVRACRRLQADVPFTVLCPMLLPRPLLGWAGMPPPVLGVDRSGLTLDIGYGAHCCALHPGWRAHLWRNRPCCFLHFVIGRRERKGVYAAEWVPPEARPGVLGGIRGRLLPAGGKRYQNLYFGNHVRFFFRRAGIDYVATLHTFGNRPATNLLGLLLAHLRPAGELDALARSPRDGDTTWTGRAGAQSIAVHAGGVWTANDGDALHGLNTPPTAFMRPALVRIDPGTRRVLARIDVGSHPSSVAVAGGAVWVAGSPGNKGAVMRVDPRTNRVQAVISTPRLPRALAADSDRLWVVTSAPPHRRGTLARIHLARNRLEGKPIRLGRAPAGIALGRGSVWVTDALTHTLTRIDATTGRKIAAIRVGHNPHGIAYGAGSVWVANADDGTVSRVDAATDELAATVPAGRIPSGIAYGHGLVWVTNLGDGTLSRIDPATNRPAGPPIYLGGEPLAVATSREAVCVTSNTEGTVTCLDPRRLSSQPR